MSVKEFDLQGHILPGTAPRAIAIIIDWVVVIVIMSIVSVALVDYPEISYIVSLVIIFGYFVGMQGATDGQTIGKMAMNLKVMLVDEANTVASAQGMWVPLFLRTLLYIVDCCCCGIIGWIIMQQSVNQQRLGDSIGRTIVVRK
jgi:uncharacterized RDD family membrane protein YckC